MEQILDLIDPRNLGNFENIRAGHGPTQKFLNPERRNGRQVEDLPGQRSRVAPLNQKEWKEGQTRYQDIEIGMFPSSDPISNLKGRLTIRVGSRRSLP